MKHHTLQPQGRSLEVPRGKKFSKTTKFEYPREGVQDFRPKTYSMEGV